jgi:hypothetical protein
LTATIKRWVKGLQGTVSWTDDHEVARKIAETGRDIFQVEDCSVYFLRTKPGTEKGTATKVLHLVASTAIPESEFENNECLVNNNPGNGLTGYAVYKNKTLNYGYLEIEKSPYHGTYVKHLDHLPSKRSKQIMVTPILNSRGDPIGALKIENKVGWPSCSRFPYIEQNLFEVFTQMAGYIIEEVRERNYIRRQQASIHNLRSILSDSVIRPLQEITEEAISIPQHPDELRLEMENIQKAVIYTASTLDRILMDPADNLILENEGLIPALRSFVSILSYIPSFAEASRRINFVDTGVRDNLTSKVRVAFYNIGREAIMNVVRHSKIEKFDAGKANVIFDFAGGSYFLTIEDNGKGFLEKDEQSKKFCFGLYDMREQVKTIKGQSEKADVELVSRPGEGTKLTVICKPLKERRNEHGD